MARKKQLSQKQVLEAVDAIIDLIATGLSARAACKANGRISRQTLFAHISKDEALQERYIAAKKSSILALIDANEDALDDLDADLRERTKERTPEGMEIEVPKYDGKVAMALVSATKLRVDERRFQAMKLLPKLYGVATGLPPGATVSYRVDLTEAPTDE
ncbi:MAG: hypothetical protein R3F54_28765 [Alphaproteobacteria bacterium]